LKELEGEEEVGIEALLEMDPPALPIPTSVSAAASGRDSIAAAGHAKESSDGSIGSMGSISHSRSGSLREPKSSVITVVERKPSTKLHKEDIPQGEEASQEVEESMEALLAKANSSVIRGQGRITKKRMPLSGADAWEMVNVDTVKYVEGDGMSRSIENVFSPVPRPPSATITPPAPPHGPRPKQSPSPQSKTKLKPKARRSLDNGDIEMKTRLDNLERKEQQIEKSIDETRKMVEEMKGRLEIVERWMAERGQVVEETGKQRKAGVWMALSASRVPGMLGLSAWFGASSSPSLNSRSAAPTKVQSLMSLIHRVAKLGLSLGTYAVLFGIGICVVLLRALGRRRGFINRLGEIGARIGNGLRR
jgi:hypothetical protein